jgi:sugar transferase (PEP-CTERM/EpsH1 system associated)
MSTAVVPIDTDPRPAGQAAAGGRQRLAAAARPVRVMHLVYRLAGGGMEHNIVKLANSHDPARVVASICSCAPADPLKERLRPSVRLFEFARREGNDFRLIWQLVQLFRQERPDIVHTHHWGTLCEGYLAARLAGVPAVVHGEHGSFETKPFNLRIQRFLWGRVERVLSVSSRLAEKLSREVGFHESGFAVIRNGVDLSRIGSGVRSILREALGVQPDELLIGTVGRLEPVKDHACLLDALAMLRDSGLSVKAVLVGDGSQRQALLDRTRMLGLEQMVHFTGVRTDVENALAAMDLFVMPSRSEGLSNTIIEAMAAGLPVVATRVGGADELIEDGLTGVLVPPASPAALAKGLARLIHDPGERRTMSRAASLKAMRDFGLDRMVREYEDLYLQLVQ